MPEVRRVKVGKKVSVTTIVAPSDVLNKFEMEIIDAVDQLQWLATEVLRRGGRKLFNGSQTRPFPNLEGAPRHRAQSQDRAAKQAKKSADRRNPKNRAPKIPPV